MTTEAAGLGLTDVLAAHRMMGLGLSDTEAVCVAEGCGWTSNSGIDWYAHVAEEVRTWLRAALDEARAQCLCDEDIINAVGCICHANERRQMVTAAETLGAK